MTCETCGLPTELCVCDDVSTSTTTITVTTEERKYNDVTLIEGLTDYDDVSDLASELKSQMACGGTHSDDYVELQGDHVESVTEYLTEQGFDVA